MDPKKVDPKKLTEELAADEYGSYVYIEMSFTGLSKVQIIYIHQVLLQKAFLKMSVAGKNNRS